MLAAGRNLSAEARLSGANLMTLPFRNGSFEAVFMFFGAIQHIPGRTRHRQAIAEMARVTQSNGRLILGLDNLAPALICYFYWLKERLTGQKQPASATQPATTTADATLWSRETRRVHPFIWHSRGLARSLRRRTWPGLVDLARRLSLFPGQAEPGDTRLAQFSLKTTPGRIYYHVYQANELIEDAHYAGWRLIAQHSGTELSEDRVCPPAIRQQDKQLFFAFRKREAS
jgi:SAM-dependent methyltransferase